MEGFKMSLDVFKMTECSWSSKALYNVVMCEGKDKSPRRNVIGNEFADQEFKSLGIDLTPKDYNKLYDVLLLYYHFKCFTCFYADQCSKLIVFIFSYLNGQCPLKHPPGITSSFFQLYCLLHMWHLNGLICPFDQVVISRKHIMHNSCLHSNVTLFAVSL